jgi:Fe2+ or Zn2+ uptake regulation protein
MDTMNFNTKITTEIAECIGLWLAEGDTKSKYEITFTNNCSFLVELFANTIQNIFKNYDLNPRVYGYSTKIEKIQLDIKCKTNYYIDKRATKPYFIYRIGSVKIVSQWKDIVKKTKNNKKFFISILRGFFAGEGNLKEGSHKNRTIRIAQGKPNRFIEDILDELKIIYRYETNERTYTITGKWNWDKFSELKIADLHPIKKEKFWRLYNSYIEIHYPDNYIRNKILNFLDKPRTVSELSRIFKRSPARIYDILGLLKKKKIVQIFRVRSRSYWINTNQNKIIVSKIKEKYLKLLKEEEKTTGELAKEMDICRKSANNRLIELQKLNLVDKDSNSLWKIVNQEKEVIIL